MNFKELFNKGKEMVVNGVATASKKVNDYKDAKLAYNDLAKKSVRIDGFSENVPRNKYLTEGRQRRLLNLCLSLNDYELAAIDGFIPIEETIIEAATIKEEVSSITYWFILTDKQIYLMTKDKYKLINYEDVKIFDIIVKDLLSTGVNFNNMAFTVEVDGTHTEKIRNILLNKDTRDQAISDTTKYLCGVIPKEQYINKYGTGITISDSGLVLHDRYEVNKLVQKNDIKTNQLILDTTVVSITGEANQSLLGVKHDCRKMDVKVTFNDGTEFVLEVLPTNTFNTSLNEYDENYIKSMDFAKKLMNIMTGK